MKAATKKRRDDDHPRFDNNRFEVTFNPRNRQDRQLYEQIYSPQQQALLDVLVAESKRHKGIITGAQIRQALDRASKKFADCKRSQLFYIFSNYRSLLVKSGFIKVLGREQE